MELAKIFKIKLKQGCFRLMLFSKLIFFNLKIYNLIIKFFYNKKIIHKYDEYLYVESFEARAKQIYQLLNKPNKKIIIYVHPKINFNLKISKNTKIIKFKYESEFNKNFILNKNKKHLFSDDVINCSFLISHSKFVILHLRDIFKGRNFDTFLNFYELHFLRKVYKILLRDKRIPKIHGQLNNISKNIIFDFVYENKKRFNKKTKIPKVVIAGFVSENLIPIKVIQKLIKFNCKICFLVNNDSRKRINNIVKNFKINQNKQIYFKDYINNANYYNFLEKFNVGLCTFYNQINHGLYSKDFTSYGSSTKLADYISVGLLPIIGSNYKFQQKICKELKVNYLTDNIFMKLSFKKFIKCINTYHEINAKKILEKHKIYFNEFLNEK